MCRSHPARGNSHRRGVAPWEQGTGNARRRSGLGSDCSLLQRTAAIALERRHGDRFVGRKGHPVACSLDRAVLLGLCVVLWVVGGLVAKRSPSVKAKKAKSPSLASPRADQKSLPAQTSARSARKSSAPADPVDDEMAEIEALLKSRGIE